ncbi:RNA-directed DNA polymerase, eukaryota, reverse transcriptase zinc-binding domain protein [Tanacetum coccineum]
MEEATNMKETNVGDNIEKEDNNIQNKTNTKKSKNGNNNLKEDELRGISKSNRFTLLNELVEEEELVPSVNEREVVDNFVKNRISPTEKDMENWNSPIIRYFKDRKEIINVIDNMEEMDSDDVVDEVNGNEKSCLRNEVDGGGGCRIMIGWYNNSVNVWVIGQSKQYMFLLVESLNRKTKFFYTVVYASNSGGERKELWKSLQNQKHIVNRNPWAVSGDFNVTLNVREHSSGRSSSFNDMKKFYECINDVELEDINSSGLITKYPDTHGCFLPFLISDHSPAILIMRNGIAKNKRGFRLVKKLKGLKGPLNKMSWKKGDVSNRVIRCRDDLKNIQSAMEKDPDNADLRNKSCELLNENNTAKKEEESMLFQKARVEWLSEGDRNASFSHKVLKERRHKSKIMAICDENGTRCENEEKVSKKEVKEALFDIEDEKAPGPDGFTSKFFKETWDTVREDVCLAIQQFFDTRKLLGEVNATLISLVPKIKTPNKVSDYRPIACYNVIYKCISKILTKRMKIVLGKLVDENQSALIAGRQITYNILLAQELLRGYNKKSSGKKCAFKIDLQKAYDTINWDFLGKCLSDFGFHSKWINWVMACIKTAKFTINVNGERVGYFNGGKGLRQGDLITPYLFTLIMETLALSKLSKEHWKNSVIIPFSMGKFPMKYLGVPLITKQLSVSEFNSISPKLNADVLGLCRAKIDSNSSHMWRTLLGMRDKVRQHIWVEIGNGQSTSVWYDYWHPTGHLSKLIEWTDKFPVLKHYGVPNLKMSGNDVTRWKDKNEKIVDFSVKQVWKDIYAGGMRGRLLTQDRIMKWKPNVTKLCRKYSMNWQSVIEEMSQLKKSKNIWCIVSKLVCGVAVYYLWSERNSRLFGGKKKTEDALCLEIEDTIRLNLHY